LGIDKSIFVKFFIITHTIYFTVDHVHHLANKQLAHPAQNRPLTTSITVHMVILLGHYDNVNSGIW